MEIIRDFEVSNTTLLRDLRPGDVFTFQGETEIMCSVYFVSTFYPRRGPSRVRERRTVREQPSMTRYTHLMSNRTFTLSQMLEQEQVEKSNPPVYKLEATLRVRRDNS